MKKSIWVLKTGLFRERNLVLVLVCLLAFGVAASASAAERTYQTAEGFYLDGGDPALVGGSMTRSLNSQQVRISAAGLASNATYTFWVVLWNRPSRCEEECGGDDIGVRGSAVFYGAGCTTAGNGTCNVSFEIEAGKRPMGKEFFGRLREEKGHEAETHIVLRQHLSPVAGEVGIQTGTFETECDEADCFDEIAVVFPVL